MKTHSEIPRKTYLQERFEILMKKQKDGKATFRELTELDEIVNRDPDIRDQIIRESFMPDNSDEQHDLYPTEEITVPEKTEGSDILRRIMKLLNDFRNRFVILRHFKEFVFFVPVAATRQQN